MITGTLRRAAGQVSGFAVVFLCVLFGFAAAHVLTFGSKVAGYRNMSHSVYTLLRVSWARAVQSIVAAMSLCLFSLTCHHVHSPLWSGLVGRL